MLTRLEVTGFKNLVDTEIRFGPFTCIAGYNGVGKSNIFDAIRFISLLADHSFLEAAKLSRGGPDVSSLFTAGGDGVMRFECDLITPLKGKDDFHQVAEASHSFLTYLLEIALVRDDQGFERIELRQESLRYVTQHEAKTRLGFKSEREWRDSVIKKSHRRAKYIETIEEGGQTRIRLSTDKMRGGSKTKRGGGKPSDFLASTLPRTVLSAAQNADEARTAVLARAEMRSWRILQLEPSSLRVPDELDAPSSLTVGGRHLPATLYRLASGPDGSRVLAEVSNRLAGLVDDVREIEVRRDDARRLLQLVLTDASGREFVAASLSDGTLRFVALSVIEADHAATGLVCLEEPENGIHPERMSAMMKLLADMATDTSEAVDEANPLRQVIVSTHSPVVVAHSDPNDLVFVDHRDAPGAKPGQYRALIARPCAGTWRMKVGDVVPIAKGEVIQYLGTLVPDADAAQTPTTYASVAEQLDLFGAGE
ncbi:MAG: AAA family ATPase [Deltaproteobacteria bacterium]|nr:AAA family ATPase [Deltaproteobacteria bacterium]